MIWKMLAAAVVITAALWLTQDDNTPDSEIALWTYSND